MIKRRLIVSGLSLLFVVFVVGLAGCGLAEMPVDNLQNSVGTGNGPGSGNWSPPTPSNQSQARQLYQVIQRLVDNTNEESNNYDQMYVQCLNDEGRPISGQENDECIDSLIGSWTKLQAMFTDFRAGKAAYETYAQEGGEEDDPPPAPDPPKPPKKDPPPTEDPDDDDPPPTTCCWCLTCTHSLDIEYVYIPWPAEIEVPSS